jgi:hypothetical protein
LTAVASPEAAHCQQRGAHCLDHRHAGSQHQARHDQESAADAEESRCHAGQERDSRCQQAGCEIGLPLDRRIFTARPQHHGTNGDHDEPEQKQEPIAVDELAQARSREGAERAYDRKDDGTSPADVSGAGMAGEIGESIHRNRKRAGADRDMGLSHAHDVEQKRGCEDGAAASDQSERKPDKRSRSERGADHRDHGRANCKVIAVLLSCCRFSGLLGVR